MSYERGVDRSQSTERLMFVYLGRDTCVYCVEMEENVFPESEVVEGMKQFVAVKIDTSAEGELASQFEVRYVPTLVFVTPEGDEVLRQEGYRSPEELLSDMESAQSFYDGEEYPDDVDEDTEDTPFPGLFYPSVGLLVAVGLYTMNQKKKRSRR